MTWRCIRGAEALKTSDHYKNIQSKDQTKTERIINETS